MFSDEHVKIDWDISLIFTPLCEIKYDGKLRAMEMFMDTPLTCKVEERERSRKHDGRTEYRFRLLH